MWALFLPTFLWLFSSGGARVQVYVWPDANRSGRAWLEWYVELPEASWPSPPPRQVEVQLRMQGRGGTPLREWFRRYPWPPTPPVQLHDTLPFPVDNRLQIRLRLVDPRLERVLLDTTLSREGWTSRTPAVVGDPVPLQKDMRGDPRLTADSVTVEVRTRGPFPFSARWEWRTSTGWKPLDTLTLSRDVDTLHLRIPAEAETLRFRLRPLVRGARAGMLHLVRRGWTHLTEKEREDLRSLLELFFPARDVERLLSTPPERRDSVWEALWKSRDPLPGTPENEFLRQVRERLQYVMQHFREGATPGYRTDRGRVYLQYGPPDGVERGELATGGRYEIWIYRDLGRAFQFEDPFGLGVYELAREIPL